MYNIRKDAYVEIEGSTDMEKYVLQGKNDGFVVDILWTNRFNEQERMSVDFASDKQAADFIRSHRAFLANIAGEEPHPFKATVSMLRENGERDEHITFVVTHNDDNIYPYRLQQYEDGKPCNEYIDLVDICEVRIEIEKMNMQHTATVVMTMESGCDDLQYKVLKSADECAHEVEMGFMAVPVRKSDGHAFNSDYIGSYGSLQRTIEEIVATEEINIADELEKGWAQVNSAEYVIDSENGEVMLTANVTMPNGETQDYSLSDFIDDEGNSGFDSFNDFAYCSDVFFNLYDDLCSTICHDGASLSYEACEKLDDCNPARRVGKLEQEVKEQTKSSKKAKGEER